MPRYELLTGSIKPWWRPRTRGNARYEVLTGRELDPIDPAGDMCPVGFRLHDDRQAGFVFTTYKVVDAYFSLAFVSPKAITDRPKTLWKTRRGNPREVAF